MGFALGDLIQGGQYPEMVWKVTHTSDDDRPVMRIRPRFGPKQSKGWQCADAWVPMRDFNSANGMEVLAWASQ